MIYRIIDFIRFWIFPAYHLRNLLFHRYDIVKIKSFKAYEYYDVVDRMLFSTMELINEFIEKEKPEDHVIWYKDENSDYDGPRYPENGTYPEYAGKYIMDVIKEIYDWWNNKLSQDRADEEYLLWFQYEYISKLVKIVENSKEDYDTVEFVERTDKISIDDLNKMNNLNFEILDRYSNGNRENLLNDTYLSDTIKMLNEKMFNDKQKYLHLAVDVRNYLWT